MPPPPPPPRGTSRGVSELVSVQNTPVGHSQQAMSTEELVNGNGEPTPPLFAAAEDPAVKFGSSMAEQLAARHMAQQKRRAPARHPPPQRNAAEDSDSDKEGTGDEGRRGAARGWREGYIDAMVARSRAISPEAATKSRDRHNLPSEVPWYASDEHREGGFRADPRYETAHRHPPPPWETAGRQHLAVGGARRVGEIPPPWERAERGAPTGGWEERAPPWKDARGGGRMRGGQEWFEESPPHAAGYARRGWGVGGEAGLDSALERDVSSGGGGWAVRSGWGGGRAGQGGQREGAVDRWMALEEEDRAAALLNMTALSRTAVRRSSTCEFQMVMLAGNLS